MTFEAPFAPANFMEWSALEWAESITTVIGVLIIIIVISAIFLERRFPPLFIHILRLLGLCILPIFLMLFGSFATFEGSKRVEFCASCHTAMSLYAEDLKQSESKTLAATHYKNRYIQENQCYNCHVNYGVFGSIKGKMTGLKHLYYWLTDSPTARGVKQIKLYSAFPNETCLRCHAGSKRFLDAFEGIHVKSAEALLKKNAAGEPELSCLLCHGPAHPDLGDKTISQKGTP